jgi:polyisoprenoid-binding protein YceI
MTRRTLLALAVQLMAAGAALADPKTRDPAQVAAGTYELDPKHASLVVRVMHMGFSHYTMRFRTLSGGFAYDPANWRSTRLTLSVDPRSVDTEDSGFNRTVAGYFEPDAYPTIQFVSTGLKETGEGQAELTGDLTFHGVTRPVTLQVVFNGAGPGLLGTGTRLGFSGSGRINRSDFKVTAMRPYVGDEVDLQFEVEFFRK